MKRSVVSYPYLRPDPQLIQAGPWKEAGSMEALSESSFRDWAPTKNLSLETDVSLNTTDVFSESGLSEGSRIAVSAYWESPGTSVRTDSVSPEILEWDDRSDQPVSVPISLEVPGHDIAQKLILGISVSVLDPGPDPGPLAPRLPGSLLWRRTETFLIEGVAPRFPVEVTEFPSSEANAAWYLSVDPDFRQPLLGGVRLYLNALHKPLMKALEARRPDAGHNAILSALYYDVGRQMISIALRNSDFRNALNQPGKGPPYEAESTGRALWSLASVMAAERGAEYLARMWESSPAEFERIMQHCFRIFGADES